MKVYKATAKEIQKDFGVTLTPVDILPNSLPEGKELEGAKLNPGDIIVVTLPHGEEIVIQASTNQFQQKLEEKYGI